MVVWWCFCGGVVMLLWWCCGVFVVVLVQCGGVFVARFGSLFLEKLRKPPTKCSFWKRWCYCGGVVEKCCDGVWWCFCGGVVVVFLWWCKVVFLW